jgi:hypothetical protein
MGDEGNDHEDNESEPPLRQEETNVMVITFLHLGRQSTRRNCVRCSCGIVMVVGSDAIPMVVLDGRRKKYIMACYLTSQLPTDASHGSGLFRGSN